MAPASASSKQQAGAGGGSAGGGGADVPVFPVGPAGRRELRRALVRSTDPARTIEDFQQKHSLHSMMARAFGTTPRHEYRVTRKATETKTVESLDTDSVMAFLSQLGVRQHDVHRRVSDALQKQLEGEIRKTKTSNPKSKEKLLELLKSCWIYATTIRELRPVLLTVLKQLGEQTPVPVLLALCERGSSGDAAAAAEADDDASATTKKEAADGKKKKKDGLGDQDGSIKLKHREIFTSLEPPLKRLCWEADWVQRVPLELLEASGASSSAAAGDAFLRTVKTTLLYETLDPLLVRYTTDPGLVDAADRPYVSTVSERRVLTKQRRALSSTVAAASASAATSASGGGAGTMSSLLKQTAGAAGAAAASSTAAAATATSTSTTTLAAGASAATTSAGGAYDGLTTGQAVSRIRGFLSDTTAGAASTYRPKLLYALLSILMAQHGSSASAAAGGGSAHGGAGNLRCTLVADLLLSAGGPLPKSYQYVLSLARLLDDCVQEGKISDASLSRIQSALREIFQTDDGDGTSSFSSPAKDGKKAAAKGSSSASPKKGKDDDEEASEADTAKAATKTSNAAANSIKRQLNRIITAGLSAMKDADPQNLFLNPVTDAIAPGYSKIIKKPMSIVTMEKKVAKSAYSSVTDFEKDVKLMFKNCVDYNRGKAGQWFRGEANRQSQVFRDEIFPQAQRLYQQEMAKRAATASVAVAPAAGAAAAADASSSTADDARKRKAAASGPDISPLPPAVKKRKKEKEEYIPSMPALACMLLADPFVVRILVSRVLQELRRGVMNGLSVPAAHAIIPSLLQLLHMARWSRKICANRGKKYLIPDWGYRDNKDPMTTVPFATLRQYIPLLLRLLLETELDKRIALGGDLHSAAAVSQSAYPNPLDAKDWEFSSTSAAGKSSEEMQVAVSLVESALVYVCQPGMGNESSLAVTFPKFALGLQSMSPWLCQDRPFFLCLMQALLRYKSKLPKPARDAVIACWLGWLRHKTGDAGGDGSVNSAGHEYLVRTLSEWSALGNVLLTRDQLLQFAREAVQAADSSVGGAAGRTCADLWKSGAADFASVKRQYGRMLKPLPAVQAEQWKQEMGFVDAVEDTNAEVEQPET